MIDMQLAVLALSPAWLSGRTWRETPNYLVVVRGHIAAFGQYEAARGFAADFDGSVFNLSGLRPK